MTSIEEIKTAIKHLPREEFQAVYDWIIESDWREWDDQIKRDNEAGLLDFLVDEARRDSESGNTTPL